MSVYPLVFSIGPIEITGYGIMMMVGFLMGGWTIQRQLRERGWNEEYAADIVVAAVIGGIVGAKLWYVALHQGPLFSRGGLVWYGGLIGGFLGVMFMGMRRKVPTRLTMELCAPAIAVGYILGRVGCFLVQDDYGFPTDLPWGLRFPEGLPASTAQNLSSQFGVPIPEGVSPTEVLAVHPTQLYEVGIMLVAFAIMWKLRHHKHAIGWMFGLYLLFAGIERFLVELLRAKDDRFLGGFTIAQLTSATAVVLGLAMLLIWRQKDDLQIPAGAVVLQRPSQG